MSEVECPYCHKDFEIDHDDGRHYNDNYYESQATGQHYVASSKKVIEVDKL